MKRVIVHVDSLALRGIGPDQAPPFIAALRAELARLLSDGAESDPRRTAETRAASGAVGTPAQAGTAVALGAAAAKVIRRRLSP